MKPQDFGPKLAGLALLAAGLGAVAAGPAAAQWRGYDGYQAYPDYPGAPLPAYPDAPPRPGARPYGSQAYSSDPYYGGYYPDAEPRGEAYAPSGGGDRRSHELSVDPYQRTAAVVPNPTNEPPGTIVIDTRSRHLYLVQSGGKAIQYGIGVGRQGFEWKGNARVGRKAEWPRWIPPKEMIARRPDLPESMEGGLENPLGARALYLYQGNRDTLFRIHGTNEPNTIGQAVSSGCIRMMNADVMDLYERVGVGTRVVVL